MGRFGHEFLGKASGLKLKRHKPSWSLTLFCPQSSIFVSLEMAAAPSQDMPTIPIIGTTVSLEKRVSDKGNGASDVDSGSDLSVNSVCQFGPRR